MLKQILRINETINDKLYNVSMQRKLKELLNTKDGLEILEWLVKRNLLDTATGVVKRLSIFYFPSSLLKSSKLAITNNHFIKSLRPAL